MGSDNSNYYATLQSEVAKTMARLRSLSVDGSKDDIVARFEAQDEATGTSPRRNETAATETVVSEASAAAAEEKSAENEGFEVVSRGKKIRPHSGEVKDMVKSKEPPEVKKVDEATTIDEAKDAEVAKQVDDDKKIVDIKETVDPTEITEAAVASEVAPEVKMSTVEPASMADLAKEWNAQWTSKPADTEEVTTNAEPNVSFAAMAKKMPEKSEPPRDTATVKKSIEKQEASHTTIAEPISASSSPPAASDVSTKSSSRSVTPQTEDEAVVPEKEVPASTNSSQADEPTKKKKRNRNKKGGKKTNKAAAQPVENSLSAASPIDADAVEKPEDVPATPSPAKAESSEGNPEVTKPVDIPHGDTPEASPELIDVSAPADANDGAIVEPSPSVAPTEIGEPVDEQIDLESTEQDKYEDVEDVQVFSSPGQAQETEKVVMPVQTVIKKGINPLFLVNVGKKETVKKASEPVDFFLAAASPAPVPEPSSAEPFEEPSWEAPMKFNKKFDKARKAKANVFGALRDEEGDAVMDAVMPRDEVEHQASEMEDEAEVAAPKKNKKCGKKGAKKGGKKVQKKVVQAVQAVPDVSSWKPVHFAAMSAFGVAAGALGYWMKG